MAHDVQGAPCGEDPGARRPGGGIVALALFLVALAVRLVYLWQSASNPTFVAPVVDAETYDRLARTLAAGGGLTHEFFWQPCFYPAFLSIVYFLSGSSIVAAKLTQALLGSATCVLTVRLGTVVFDRRAGLVAGCIAALYGPLVFFDGELLATVWAGFWSIALILLCLRVSRSNRRLDWLALGLSGALAVLTRPVFAPFLLAATASLTVAALGQSTRRRTLMTGLGLLLLGLAAVWVPAALLSRTHTGRLSILPASGGINLHIGNNPDFARTVMIRPGSEWSELTRLPRRHGVVDRKDTGRFFMERVRDYLREDPAAFVGGLVRKSGHLVSSRELPRNVDMYVFREGSGLLRALVWKIGRFGFPFGLLLPLAVIGMVLCWRQVPGPLVWFLVLYPVSIVLVFVTARYRTPIVPALAVVAGGGCCALVRTIAERHWRRALGALTAAVATTLLATLPGPFPQEQADLRAELHYFVGTRAMNEGDLESAVNQLRRATQLEPSHSDAHNQLGIAYTRLNNLTLAADHFDQAVRSNPRSVTARTNLARLRATQGRLDEAVREFRSALEQDPFDLDLRYHFGTVLVKLKQPHEAEQHLRRVVAGRPDDADAHNALGHALHGQGRLEAAVREFGTALRIDGLHRGALDALAATLIDLGRVSEVPQLYRAALERARMAGDRALVRHIERKLDAAAALAGH